MGQHMSQQGFRECLRCTEAEAEGEKERGRTTVLRVIRIQEISRLVEGYRSILNRWQFYPTLSRSAFSIASYCGMRPVT